MSPLSSDEAYRQAGVDLKRAEEVVGIAQKAAQKTAVSHLLSGIGSFSGAFEIPEQYRRPVLLSACDGVGTKLKLAFMTGIHHTVGIDLVAMSVNDILANGGEPLVFLDYFATTQIQSEILEPVLEGVAQGCREAGCALVGGETAEMPGFYAQGEYDLAGFCVGVAEKNQLYPQKDRIASGDVLIGLASSGLHSNGYSLVRKVLLEDHAFSLTEIPLGLDKPLGEVLLTPTRIYVKPVLKLLQQFPEAIKAMVHVTGGGFYDNIPRVLPEGFSAIINGNSWPQPPIFSFLQQAGGLTPETMYHTFNCGIGYVLVVDSQYQESVLNYFKEQESNFPAYAIGTLQATLGYQEVQIQ
jgi:phosphoribosylformylglycinamidine cyclo-ligase